MCEISCFHGSEYVDVFGDAAKCTEYLPAYKAHHFRKQSSSFLLVLFWVRSPCGLVGNANASEKPAISIFSAEVGPEK
jgi:hypothetical protein